MLGFFDCVQKGETMVEYKLFTAKDFHANSAAFEFQILVPDKVYIEQNGQEETYTPALIRFIVNGNTAYEVTGVATQQLAWRIQRMIEASELLKPEEPEDIPF